MNLLPDTQDAPNIELISVPCLASTGGFGDVAGTPATFGSLSWIESVQAIEKSESTLTLRAAILQGHVFRSLIQRLLYTCSMVDGNCNVKNFFREKNSAKEVDLSPVPSLLRAWYKKLKEMRSEARADALKTVLQSVIEISNGRISLHNLWIGNDSWITTKRLNMPLEKIDFSIQVLGELIWDVVASACIQNGSQVDMICPFSESATFADYCLHVAGWENSEIPRLPKDTRFRYYASRFKRDSLGRTLFFDFDNSQSLDLGISNISFVPNHITSDCSCTFLGIKPDKLYLQEPLNKNTKSADFPLIKYSPAHGIQEVNFAAVPASFVAFSHVRSQGLGNDTANSLPLCQVQRLQGLANKASENSANNDPTPFWIDTLCLPLSHIPKRQAIGQIESIFQRASRVVVLDQQIFTSPLASPQEILFRMRYSSWAKRFWTLQEAAVAQDLFFDFPDRFMRMQDLLQLYDHDEEYAVLRSQCFKDQRYDDLLVAKDPAYFESLSRCWSDVQSSHVVERLSSSPQDFRLNRYRLRSVLRLGYLAVPQLRLLAEAFESSCMSDVVTVIDSLYSRVKLEGESSQLAEEAIEARLKTILSLSIRLFTQDSFR